MRVQITRAVLAVAALAAVLYGCILVLSPFISPILWALILGSATWPAYRRLRDRLGGRRTLAALSMTALLVLLLLVPTGLLGFALLQELEPQIARLRAWATAPVIQWPEWVNRVPLLEQLLQDWADRLSDNELRQVWIRELAGQAQQVLRLGRNVAQHLLNGVLIVFTLFFVYRDGETLVSEVGILLDRIIGERGRDLFQAVRETVSAVVYGWLMTAAAQGLVAMVGYWLAGVPAPVLLGVATGLCAVIPFGVSLVFIPVIAGLAIGGEWGRALFVALWSFLFVSLIDNFLRPLFISGSTRIPFIVVFFGVLGGLAAFGLVGLVLGPVILAVVLALMREARESLAEAVESPEGGG
ncbi:MAG: AI-2E family transporter [Acidobacteria bacterium]|nr:MAG: AI-2E family transporter [Acidobacteriota bacterium]